MIPGEAPTKVIEPFGPGSLLGDRYRIAKQIGKGGFGCVYLAYDEKLHRKPVVLKVLNENAGEDAWRQTKFRKESEALSRIDHPGVVGVLDQGTTPEGKLFIVMQFVDGVTLRSAMAPGPLSFSRAANIIRQTAEALTAAHDQGICHRDLKPENIMLRALAAGREQVVIIDFGIAAVGNSSVPAAGKTKIAGSPTYMAPEQLEGNPQQASDIYTLGVIAYELVTGRLPFECDSVVELYRQQQRGVRKKPSDIRPELPSSAGAAILKALSFDPQARYARALDFADAFADALPDATSEQETLGLNKSGAQLDSGASSGAFVLFISVVGYSRLTTDRQNEIVRTLGEAVRSNPEYPKVNTRRDPTSVPTGHGLALVFLDNPTSPVQCAVDLSRALKAHAELHLRMGIDTGTVFRAPDTNQNLSGADDGINRAQRVMECGDAGHILVSSSVADTLMGVSAWSGWLHDLGECRVKPGARMRIYNLCRDDVGNPALPLKLGGKKNGRARWMGAIAAAVMVLALSMALWGYWHRVPGRKTDTAGGHPTAIQRSLTYYFSVRPPKSPDWRRYSHEMIVPAGYRMVFNFESSEPGHLYILNEGPEPVRGRTDFNTLYPASSGGSSFVDANRELRFPPGDGFVLDRKVGTEKLFVVWSSREIAELEDLKKWANPRDAGAVQSLADLNRIQDFLLQNPSLARAEDQAGRTVLTQAADPLMYVIRLEHM